MEVLDAMRDNGKFDYNQKERRRVDGIVICSGYTVTPTTEDGQPRFSSVGHDIVSALPNRNENLNSSGGDDAVPIETKLL